MNKVKWTWVHTALSVAPAGALSVYAIKGVEPSSALTLWWLIMACLALFIVILGHGITGRFRGAWIDDRNVVSLSRFQILAWTVLILSAFLAAALCNIRLNVTDPISIQLDSTLWMLMGISTTSLVASPLILSGKKSQQPDAGQMQQVFELLVKKGEGPATNQGLIVANRDISQARWTDMFTGEETGNAAHLDLARVQMFFFTCVALLAYGAALAAMFSGPDVVAKGVSGFPKLSEGVLALIGISHTGYLAAKAAPLSKTQGAGGTGG